MEKNKVRMFNLMKIISGLTASFLRGRSSMVEPQPSKLMMWVRSPSPAPLGQSAHIAQSVEHLHGKEGVTGSNPVVGSRKQDTGICISV